jgi:hypothetical protein
MPGSRSGEVAGKAGAALSRYGPALRARARSCAKPRALAVALRTSSMFYRMAIQARDEVLIKYTLYRLLDASGVPRVVVTLTMVMFGIAMAPWSP